MKTKFGAIIVDGRGKIGGHVASKNRGGAYLRTKVTPVNRQTNSQLGVRNRFTSLSQGWRSLTEDQRNAWNAAVSGFQRTNIFGDLVSPSGLNLYQRLNNVLLSLSEAIIVVPPSPAIVTDSVLSAITATATGSILTCAFAPTVAAGMAVKVFATTGMSAGRSFVKADFRLIAVLPAASITGMDISDDYVAKFGSFPLTGQKIFVKFVTANIATGQVGSASQAQAIVG